MDLITCCGTAESLTQLSTGREADRACERSVLWRWVGGGGPAGGRALDLERLQRVRDHVCVWHRAWDGAKPRGGRLGRREGEQLSQQDAGGQAGGRGALRGRVVDVTARTGARSGQRPSLAVCWCCCCCCTYTRRVAGGGANSQPGHAEPLAVDAHVRWDAWVGVEHAVDRRAGMIRVGWLPVLDDDI